MIQLIQRYLSTLLAILSKASFVPFKTCFLIVNVNKLINPFIWISQSTFISHFFASILARFIVFVPIIGPSLITIVICLRGISVTYSRHFECLKAIMVSRSVVFPSLLMFFTAFMPCQLSGSSSILEIILHINSSEELIILVVDINVTNIDNVLGILICIEIGVFRFYFCILVSK